MSGFLKIYQNFDQMSKFWSILQNSWKFLQNCLSNSDLAENRFSQNDGRDPKLKILSLLAKIVNFIKISTKMSKFWSVLAKFEVRGQILVPGSKFEGPRVEQVILAILVHFGSRPQSDPDRSGSDRNFQKARLWLKEPDRSHEGLMAAGTKIDEIGQILRFDKILSNFEKFSRFWQFWRFLKFWLGPRQGPGWPLMPQPSISVFLDCVWPEGQRTEILDFWSIFDHFDFWDFEISEIWLKFSIITFGCEELSWRVGSRSWGRIFRILAILGHFWHFWLMICHPLIKFLVIFGHFGRFWGPQGPRRVRDGGGTLRAAGLEPGRVSMQEEGNLTEVWKGRVGFGLGP